MSDEIYELEDKIRELEDFNSRIIGAMNAMDGITQFQKDVLAVEEISNVYEVASDRLKKITEFKFLSFFSINETMAFDLSYVEPESLRDEIQQEFDKQMKAGMLAWALNSDKSINATALTGDFKDGPQLLIHPLESNTGINGLFVGQPVADVDEMHQLDLTLLNVSLSSTSLALDNTSLTQQLKESNADLENKVEARTETLQVALEKANEATKAKSEFLATMSHEIRTPMNGVLGMCELMLETGLNDEQYKYASVINNSGKALLTIINDILDFSKIEAGKLELEYIPFDLRDTIEDVVHVLSQRAAEKGIELISDIDCRTPTAIVGDSMRLRQILLNLGSNAIKFTDKGHVLFALTADIGMDGSCTMGFRVEDTGIGIPEDKLGRLFQSFSQVDSSTSRRYGGTGLGLTISQSLCEMMGGKVYVESEFNKGSTFGFDLDFEVNELEPSAIKEEELAKKRVLLASSHEGQTKLVKDYLEWSGMIVDVRKTLSSIVVATSGSETYDYLIVDFGLMGSSRSILDEILEIARQNCGKCFLMKPYVKTDLLAEVETKFDESIAKPLNYNVLVNTLLNRNLERNVDIESFHLPETKTWNVLLVDDDRTNLEVAKLRFEKMNLKVTMAASGEEALSFFEKAHFDIVFMDCHMPDMDGYMTTKMIRQIELEKNLEKSTPVMALSANVAEDAAKKCYAAGMDDYLTKPIIIADLIRALRKWLLSDADERWRGSTKVNLPPKENVPPGKETNSTPQATSESVDESFMDVTVIRDLLGIENYDFEKSLINTFLIDSFKRHGEIAAAFESDDVKKVNYLSHTIKGGAGNIGAKAIQRNCKTIEDFSGEGDLSNVEPLISQLLDDLNKLQVFFDTNYFD
ncbi:MAG: ATP-binding protein [Lentisphaerales bacterium]|nr:ATP-binding protein [Lentisphaerales bacterium]